MEIEMKNQATTREMEPQQCYHHDPHCWWFDPGLMIGDCIAKSENEEKEEEPGSDSLGR